MASRSFSLLLVDDDPSAIQVMSRMLAQFPDQRFATSGKAALRLAREAVPDLILLDAEMPGMTGFEVHEALRSDPLLAGIPVIFTTSHAAPAMKAAALAWGAADYLTKPLVPAQLMASVLARLRSLLPDPLSEPSPAQLPVQAPGGDRIAPAPAAPQPSLDRPRILIVDCDLAAIERLRLTLAPIGDCHVATSADEAILLASRLCPDLVLLEGDLPGVDGFAVGASILAWPDFKHVPIVFVVAQADAVTEQRALDLGAADFVAKPFAPALLQARIRNLLARAQLARRTDTELQATRALRCAADAAGRRKTLLMSCIAQEMGKPLNGLLDSAGLIAADADHPLAGAQADRLARIVADGQRLHALMGDVLDFSHFQAGESTLALRALDAAGCARTAAAAVAALAAQAGITLSTLPGLSTVHCAADAERLQECLVNLLTNAIRYNRPGGWARIEVQHDADEVAIAVRDNGPGIGAVQREHLFEPFNRLGRPHAATRGASLGLIATRHLVRAMNGQLTVDSEPGRGSCFTIVLPVALDPVGA